MDRISLTVDEVCERNRCSRPFIYKQINEGRLKSIRVGRMRRIMVEHEQEWLAAHIAPAKQAAPSGDA